MRDVLNGKKWPVIIVASAGVAVTGWYWFANRSALDYGRPGATYFDRQIAAPGEEIEICFDNVVWRRICPSKLVSHITCVQRIQRNGRDIIEARGFNPPAYNINVPMKTGPIVKKCRPFVLPTACQPGPLRYEAFAQSECPPFGNVVYSKLPPLDLNVVATAPVRLPKP